MNFLSPNSHLPHSKPDGASFWKSDFLRLQILENQTSFLGLGEVEVGGVALRSPRRPMSVELDTPDGWKVCDLRLISREQTPDSLVLELDASFGSAARMEWMLHEVRSRRRTGDWTRPPVNGAARLRLELRALSRSFGGQTWRGFSYQYFYESASHPIYQILDRATWEIGGAATGNEIWMRSCFAPGVCSLESDNQAYSTEWYEPSAENPNIFQFLPLQTELQGFTFTAHQAGVLATWPREVAHVRTLLEKEPGAQEIAHFHEHCGDLSQRFQTAPVEVLFLPGEFHRVERANLYETFKEMVHDTLHHQANLRRERISTYAMIEEWGHADVARYAAHGVPKLTDAGVQSIEVFNHFRNNMNTLGVSNACCTLSYDWAEEVGPHAMRALCESAQAGGARVVMWGNTALSSLNWMFSKTPGADSDIWLTAPDDLQPSPAPWIRNPSGAIEADHYTPIFCALNLRDQTARDYWVNSWKRAGEETGLAGIFLDSSFNMSSDKFHWLYNPKSAAHHGVTADQTHLLGQGRPVNEPPQAILSQYHAHLEMVGELQGAGFLYCNEDLGVFGVHRHGPSLKARLSCLWLWSDCVTAFDAPAIEAAGYEASDVFFRALAFRMMWILYWNIEHDCLSWAYSGSTTAPVGWEVPTPAQLNLLRAYNALEGQMLHREIVSDPTGTREMGVLYGDGDGHLVFWAFEEGPLPAAFCGAFSLREWNATAQNGAEESPLYAKPHHIYTAQKAAVNNYQFEPASALSS